MHLCQLAGILWMALTSVKALVAIIVETQNLVHNIHKDSGNQYCKKTKPG